MITIEKCKEILNANDSNRKYTNEEVKIIRDFLYKAANLEHEKFKHISVKGCIIQKSIH